MKSWLQKATDEKGGAEEDSRRRSNGEAAKNEILGRHLFMLIVLTMSRIHDLDQRCQRAILSCLDELQRLKKQERTKDRDYFGSFLIDYGAYQRSDNVEKLSYAAFMLERYLDFLVKQ